MMGTLTQPRTVICKRTRDICQDSDINTVHSSILDRYRDTESDNRRQTCTQSQEAGSDTTHAVLVLLDGYSRVQVDRLTSSKWFKLKRTGL